MRICSLLPSATEILYALGLGDSVVGVTHECDHPAEAARKPRLIRPRVDPSAPAAEVDRQVKELLARGESIYFVDDVLFHSLAPDLVVTQDLCHVCAASPDDLAAVLARMENAPRVLSLTPHTLADVWEDIRRVGQATAHSREAEKLANGREERVAAVAAKVCGASSRPRVLCLEWLDPPYCGGHWVPEMVELGGGVDVLGRAGKPSYELSWEEILKTQPDVIVVMPCGYNLAHAVEGFQKAPFPSGWNQLPAVRAGRLFAVDASSYFSRPGPRLADGVAVLAEILHAELGHTGPPCGSFAQLEF